ncbi:Protein N-methyltransferase NNT1 [Meyerozyma sp. JA9]|nr:Protein N-methyltransferase NNT1 [Meyerozyma sp. JA9]
MSDDEIDVGLFEEPEGFLPPPPEPHFATYERKINGAKPSTIEMRLVGKSPLWGHMLWNAGIYTADYLDKHSKELVRGKRVLELGAAAGLPSLVCGLNEAAYVLSTDYPDPDLIANIQYNVDHTPDAKNIEVRGYIWGNDIGAMMFNEENKAAKEDEKFDLIILSDLIFNHNQHHNLLKSCKQLLNASGLIFVVFSPHRAHLLHEDLRFFETCKEYGFKSKQNDMQIWNPMFEEEEETAEIRSRVYSYFLEWDR